MIREYRTAKSRRLLAWMGLLAAAVGLLLVAGGCGIVGGDDETSSDGLDAPQDSTPVPTAALTILDLPGFVLHREDIPAELEFIPTTVNKSQVEYTVEYQVPDLEATATGWLSASSKVRIGLQGFPSMAEVRSLQRHTEGAVEVENIPTFGDDSVLYRVTALANHSDHQIYYGYINYGGLSASVVGKLGTLPEVPLEDVEATLPSMMLLMQAQEARLLATGPSTANLNAEPTATPRVFTRLELPAYVLQRSDVPPVLALVPTDISSEAEYTDAYELPDPEASLTGWRSVSSTIHIGSRTFPTVEDVRSLQRHTETAVEIENIATFGEESVLYRVTALADGSDHQIYYGYINYGGLSATVIAAIGTLPGTSLDLVDTTIADIVLLMEAQEASLLASDS